MQEITPSKPSNIIHKPYKNPWKLVAVGMGQRLLRGQAARRGGTIRERQTATNTYSGALQLKAGDGGPAAATT